MGTQAVGAYIKTLREARGLSQVQVAALIDSNETQIRRIERGRHDALGTTLAKTVKAVQGNMQHIQTLLLQEDDSPWLGEELARAMLEMQPSAHHRRYLMWVIEQVVHGRLTLDEAISHVENLDEIPIQSPSQ